MLRLRLFVLGSTERLVLAFGDVRVITEGVTVDEGAFVVDNPDAAKVFAAKSKGIEIGQYLILVVILMSK